MQFGTKNRPHQDSEVSFWGKRVRFWKIGKVQEGCCKAVAGVLGNEMDLNMTASLCSLWHTLFGLSGPPLVPGTVRNIVLFLKRNRVTTPTCQPMDIWYNLCKYTPPLLLDMLRFFRGVDKSNRVVYPSLAFLGDGPSLGFPGERYWPFWSRWVLPCRASLLGRLWIPFGIQTALPPRCFAEHHPLFTNGWGNLLGTLPNTTRLLRMDEAPPQLVAEHRLLDGWDFLLRF